MYPISEKKKLKKFTAVRCLSGRDLFARYGERVPQDRGTLVPHKAVERQDYASRVVKSTYEDYVVATKDVPPAIQREEEDPGTE